MAGGASPFYISQQHRVARSPACRAGKPTLTALFHLLVVYFLGNSLNLSELGSSDTGLAKMRV